MQRQAGLPRSRPGQSPGRGARLRSLAVPLSVLLLAEAGLAAGAALPAAAAPAAPAAQAAKAAKAAPARAGGAGAGTAPDEASARTAAAAQERQVEVLGARTENTTVWANPDGTMTMEAHAGPVRFKRNGAWVDVDATLVEAADGSVRAKAHPRGLRLSGGTGSAGGDLVTLGSGARTVTLGWKGKLPEPVLKGHRATYVNVMPATDLVVEATRTGFEQYLVLKDRSAAERVEDVALPLRAKGLDAVRGADGSVALTDGEDRTVGRIPAPVMWDSAGGKKRTGGHRAPVGLKIAGRDAGDADGVELRLSPDRDFLADPGTTYPVTVDPAVYLGSNFDTSVRKGFSEDLSSSIALLVGREYGKEQARSFLHFPQYDAILGKEILNAELNLYAVWSDTCTPKSWEVWDTGLASSSTRWSNQPAWRAKVATSTETLGHSADCAVQWVHSDITDLVGKWAKKTDATQNAVGLRATNETEYESFKIFASSDDVANAPSLLVTYQTPADPVKDHVEYWNDVLLATYRTVGGPPGPLSRAGAMMHGAIYDAANSARCAEGATRCLGAPYLVKVPVTGAVPDINSAIDHAAFGVLDALYPDLDFDDDIANARSSIPAAVTAEQRAAGTSVGQQAAAAMLNARQADGSVSGTVYNGSETPGFWRPTDGTPGDTPDWGLVKPFALTSGSQFRPAGPAGHTTMAGLLGSSAYATQVNEVKDIGGAESTTRTADQTQAALFWANDLNGTYKPPGQLFEMTRIVSDRNNVSLEGNVKLFALAAFSMADAAITAWDAKYRTEVDLWRPESAIRLDGDGNAATTADPDWQPLSQDYNGAHFSPAFPAYISGHATFAGAWAKAMEQWFRTDSMTFTATTDDPNAVGVTRTFTSFSGAAAEDAQGRVWLGVHYSWDGTDGVTAGNRVAEHVAVTKLKPNQSADWTKYEDLRNLAGCEAVGRKLVAEHRWSSYRCERVTTANTDHVLYVK
ncbi:DNRLRE domain-containing protein [Streptomyces thermolineatus]|uniref:DNRLRE domain-containing protein n=1 Tax=Streptomyces thermolineatus TaxID=44033 RepID=UPI00384D10CB